MASGPGDIVPTAARPLLTGRRKQMLQALKNDDSYMELLELMSDLTDDLDRDDLDIPTDTMVKKLRYSASDTPSGGQNDGWIFNTET